MAIRLDLPISGVVAHKLEYCLEVDKKLAGGQVKGVFINNDGHMALRIEVGKKTFDAWVLSDEEGNDVGHLDIQEVEG